MNNNPYVRPYMPNYNNFNQQNMYEQIDNQINQLQQMREQIKNNANQQPAINQTFQLAPTGTNTMRYVNTIDDVSKEVVYGDTPFFSKDLSVLWIKSTKGSIKTYELNEIIPKDEKDIKIEYLMAQIEELKKGMSKNESNDDVNEPVAIASESEEPATIPTISKSSKKSRQPKRDIDGNDE